jgi:hypothetical protein
MNIKLDEDEINDGTDYNSYVSREMKGLASLDMLECIH